MVDCSGQLEHEACQEWFGVYSYGVRITLPALSDSWYIP